jgi:type II secretion system protein G
MKTKKKGFTLIELLVVIAIIGILATVVMVSLNTARRNSRDARRVSDLRQIALALEMYSSEKGGYPAATAATCNATTYTAMTGLVVTAGYLPSSPLDPTNNATYFYAYGANSATADAATDYTLKAVLENTASDLLDSDIDLASLNNCVCTDGANYCTGP